MTEKGNTNASIAIKWNAPVQIGNIVLKENICCSQRVERFEVEALIDGIYIKIYNGTVIGYKRIIPLGEIETKEIRIKITDSRTEPTISFIGVYKSNY